MRKRRLGWVGVAVLAAAVGSITVRAAPPQSEQAGMPPKPSKLAEKSVTVFPVVITPDRDFGPDFRKRIAEVVGMLLERAEMNDVRLGGAEFLPKQGDKVDQVAGAFGQFVAAQNLETPYALFAEIRGERQKGIEAIRTIVVDAKGSVVLAEEIQREAFARSAPMVPKDPMSCAVFIASRLREPWDLADPLREDAPDGQVQENWRKKSGLPTDEEVEAIKQREAKLREQLAESSLEICPAYAGQKPAPETPAALSALLADAGFASVQAVDKGPDLKGPGSPNEQEVLWRTARQARAYFQQHSPSAHYVLVTDFAIGRTAGKTKVGAVHWILCDQRGNWVMVDYQNSHHSDFQEIEPDSVEDCLELVKVRLKKRLAAAK